jgi:hypothetical protein
VRFAGYDFVKTIFPARTMPVISGPPLPQV